MMVQSNMRRTPHRDNFADNCPCTPNATGPGAFDSDGDGVGNGCDPDTFTQWLFTADDLRRVTEDLWFPRLP